MKDRCLVAILATDKTLMTKVAKKLTSSKPVDIYYCIDLKDFLTQTIENPPDIVGVSMNYQHKNIIKFPKLFKMSLNAPVIVFTEMSDVHYQRLLNSAQSEYKIAGTLNPHNLWFKINSILNQQEPENLSPIQMSVMDKRHDMSGAQPKNSVFLKGNKSSTSLGANPAMLTQLFAALNDDSGGDENSIGGYISSDSSLKNNDNQFNFSDYEQKKSQETAGVDGLGLDVDNQEANQNSSEMYVGKDKPSLMIELDPTDADKDDDDDKNKNQFFGEGLEKKSQNANEPELDHQQNDKREDKDLTGERFNGIELQESSLEHEANNKNKSPNKDFDRTDFKNDQPFDKENLEDTSFGKIKLIDDGKDKNKKLKKDKKKRDEQKSKKALEQSCDEALRELFFSKPLLIPRDFESQFVHLYIVEMQDYKGFLMLNNSFNQNLDAHILSNFRSLVIENLKKKGLSAHLSNDFLITADLEAYNQVVSEFSEFVIHHEEETGKQQVVSFVRREVVQPKISESDKEGMYLVDLKVIPPHTLVNFDAFIFLPKNNRFVRYLKNGRSLSLEQAKRRSEENESTSLYLPKADKQKFIQFYIQNTINWELAIYQTNSAKKKLA